MPSYLKMPKLSDTMTEGKLVKWLKKEGDLVSIDDELAEIETDKATMSMPSFDEGILHEIYIKEGETVPLGAILGVILEEGEEPPKEKPENTTRTVDNSDKTEKKSKNDAKLDDKLSTEIISKNSSHNINLENKIKASPLAKKIAKNLEINLSNIVGSGPKGRIVKKDVENFNLSNDKISYLNLSPKPLMSKEDKIIPLSGMRKTIAYRLTESKTTIPHFYLNIEIDTDPLMKMRSQVNESSVSQNGPKYTVNDFIMRASVLAVGQVPKVNASFQNESIIEYKDINLAIAVAIDNGLVTPVIRSSQNKSIKNLSLEMKSLASKARNGKLTPNEMQGGTLTISNLGSFGINSFDAIINPPQSLILSIGTISKQPVVNEYNQIIPGQRMWIGMSCDHRVIDGAIGAKFMSKLKYFIENPILLIS